MTDETKKEAKKSGRAVFGGQGSMFVDAQVITAASTSANTLIEELTKDFSKEITKEAAKVKDTSTDKAAP
jgi:hypothetical protein